MLDAHTATPGWVGEWLNLGYAIDVLHPLAIATRDPGPTPDLSSEIQLGVARDWRDRLTPPNRATN